MCELLGFSCRIPSDIGISLGEFCCRGGVNGIHKDGWGIAFSTDEGFKIFLEDIPSSRSKFIDLIRNSSIKANTVISHIRRATVGSKTLINNQPFTRILWGKQWVFAHNGDLPEFNPSQLKRFNVMGDTDSEKVFCYILDKLSVRFADGKYEVCDMVAAISEIVQPLNEMGVLNFLISDGEHMFAQGHSSLYYLFRKAPFGKVTLRDSLAVIDYNNLNSSENEFLLVATRPLTIEENWRSLRPREVFAFKAAKLLN